MKILKSEFIRLLNLIIQRYCKKLKKIVIYKKVIKKIKKIDITYYYKLFYNNSHINNNLLYGGYLWRYNNLITNLL